MKRRWNSSLWIGFAIVVAAVISYIPLFARFPSTRDVPWANYLLFALGLAFLAVGLKRAFGQPQMYRGKISGSILGVLSVLLVGFFCFGVIWASKQIPASPEAVRVGQLAPDFTLAGADGKQVSLADLAKNNRAVLLIFYRGYW